jgi:hypothetical protein
LQRLDAGGNHLANLSDLFVEMSHVERRERGKKKKTKKQEIWNNA